MAEPNDDLPEIKLDDIVGAVAPTPQKRLTDPSSLALDLELDIDMDEPPAAKPVATAPIPPRPAAPLPPRAVVRNAPPAAAPPPTPAPTPAPAAVAPVAVAPVAVAPVAAAPVAAAPAAAAPLAPPAPPPSRAPQPPPPPRPTVQLDAVDLALDELGLPKEAEPALDIEADLALAIEENADDSLPDFEFTPTPPAAPAPAPRAARPPEPPPTVVPLLPDTSGESRWEPAKPPPPPPVAVEPEAEPEPAVSASADSTLDALLADLESAAAEVAELPPPSLDETELAAPELPDVDFPDVDVAAPQRPDELAELGVAPTAQYDVSGLAAQLEAAALGEPAPETPFVVTPDDPDAPPLPISADEPAPVSRVPPSALMPDPATFENLRRLAGAGAEPEAARDALMAALLGESYDVRALPDARVIVLGLARVLVQRGQADAVELVSAIMAALEE